MSYFITGDKKGDPNFGKAVKFNAVTNYFEIAKRPDWNLLQYRVDFKPDVDETLARKRLLRIQSVSAALNNGFNIFDGTMLFMTARVQNDQISFTGNNFIVQFFPKQSFILFIFQSKTIM